MKLAIASCLILVFSGIFLPDRATAQEADSSQFRATVRRKWQMEHSPLKATVYSMVLPGAGQAYNKKWWKLPIVYAGIGVCTYFIVDNTRNYHRFRDSYIAVNDGDPSTTPALSPLEYNLDLGQETYHRWLEWSYLSLGAVYLLQVIDANVDAHLYYFDVGPDLGLQVHPTVLPMHTGHITTGLGVTLRL